MPSKMERRKRKVTRVVLAATRLWLPVAIALAGVVLIVLGHGRRIDQTATHTRCSGDRRRAAARRP